MTTPPEVSRGGQIFQDNCAGCHGSGGEGNGPAAAGLTPRPADLTGLAARNGGVFPTARVMSAIDGYTRKGSRSEMPEFGAYLKDAEVVLVDVGDGVQTPTPEPLYAVTSFLESIQKP
jgi:mono/diheme cytochrome c family protein